MANTITSFCANPFCRRAIILGVSDRPRRYCNDPECCRQRAAARQAKRYRKLATDPSLRAEYRQMLSRKKAERLRRERCREFISAATQAKRRHTFAATTPPGATSPLMLLLFCLMSMQFGALAILLNSRNTASLLDELETCFRIGRELLGKNLENLPLREIFLTGVFQSKSSQ